MSIDWISATRKKTLEQYQMGYTAHPSLHDWENWEDDIAKLGYTSGSRHATGVRVYANDKRQDMGYHIVYSGEALRRVEDYAQILPHEILLYHVTQQHSIARLDIAIDFINTGLRVQDFINCYKRGDVQTRIKTVNVTQSLSSEGATLYIGSMKKRKKLIRIYNKAAEQNLSGDWTRLEAQIMGKPATKISKELCEGDDFKSVAIGAIKAIADYNGIPQWDEISRNVDVIDIGSISSEKGDTRKWLIDQCVPALAKELGLDSGFLDEFNEALRRKMVELGLYR